MIIKIKMKTPTPSQKKRGQPVTSLLRKDWASNCNQSHLSSHTMAFRSWSSSCTSRGHTLSSEISSKKSFKSTPTATPASLKVIIFSNLLTHLLYRRVGRRSLPGASRRGEQGAERRATFWFGDWLFWQWAARVDRVKQGLSRIKIRVVPATVRASCREG